MLHYVKLVDMAFHKLEGVRWDIVVSGIVTSVVAIVGVLFLHMRITRTGRLLGRFPTIARLPFFGSVMHMRGNLSYRAILGGSRRVGSELAQTFSKVIKKHGRRIVLWKFHIPLLVVTEAEAVGKILSSPKYIEKGRDYKMFHFLFGEGLITSNGHVWKEDRKLLNPYFKYQKFDGFLECFNRNSRILVEILTQQFSTSKAQDIDIHPTIARATMDFISESAMGQRRYFQKDLNLEFFKAIGMALDSFRTRIVKPWLTFPIVWELFGLGKQDRHCLSIFSKMTEESITNRKQILEEEEASGVNMEESTKPFIDAILKWKTQDQITAHIATMFGAGFETTASGMNYCLFLLANNPDCQRKVHEELDLVFSGDKRGDDGGLDVTFSDLAELKYLEMCIKETLRLYPPAPIIMRNMTEDLPLDGDQVIPKGIDVMIIIRELHRDPKHFPVPEKFDPERFLPEVCATRHYHSYIPFSSGPRNCIGMKYAMVQMKCCLAHILNHFSVVSDQRIEDIKPVYGMVLEAFPSIELKLVPRVMEKGTTIGNHA